MLSSPGRIIHGKLGLMLIPLGSLALLAILGMELS